MCMVKDPETGKVAVLDKVGKWSGLTFPGGHVEKRESLSYSVVREVYEETGLTIENPRACGTVHWYNTDTDFRYLVFLYTADRFTGELIQETGEGRVSWMTLEEMLEGKLAGNMETYIKVMLSDEFNEVYGEWSGEGKAPLKLL